MVNHCVRTPCKPKAGDHWRAAPAYALLASGRFPTNAIVLVLPVIGIATWSAAVCSCSVPRDTLDVPPQVKVGSLRTIASRQVAGSTGSTGQLRSFASRLSRVSCPSPASLNATSSSRKRMLSRSKENDIGFLWVSASTIAGRNCQRKSCSGLAILVGLRLRSERVFFHRRVGKRRGDDESG